MYKMKYSSLSLKDKEVFKEMFSTFQDLILAMVSNSVRVLPSKCDFKSSLKTHLSIVKNLIKSDYRYEEFIDIKNVFLSCIANKLCRKKLDLAVSHFTIDDKQKVRFSIKDKFYSRLDDNSRLEFDEDIKMLESIINCINDDFNKRLPIALQNGMLISKKVHSADVPRKAKYVNLTKKGRS